MAVETGGTIQALATVNAGGAAFAALSAHPGFSNVANAGAGLNNLTLEQAADQSQSYMFATPRSAVADTSCQTQHVSDTVKQVRTYAAGVLADTVAFDVALLRAPDGLA